MLATGLRLGDACALAYDPVVFDNDRNPYIRYWNHKMRREAYVPISAATLDRIRDQQQRTLQRFRSQAAAYLAAPAPRTLPDVGLRLTPKLTANPHGLLPFHTASYQQQLRAFVAAANITDEAGRPVAITAHQWRHTFATGLINRGVRLEVVKQLLDHASLEMSSHYARLLDTTIRAEWEAAHAAGAAGYRPDASDDEPTPRGPQRRGVGQPSQDRAAERTMRATAPAVLRSLQQVPVLPGVHHHQPRPPSTRGPAPPHPHADHALRCRRPDPNGRPEPACPGTPRRADR